ncbi:MAG: ribonuclease P protein component [Actinobacteria bacterium]|nr:ribonuclease P protein component [Actinomycetota bacterium]
MASAGSASPSEPETLRFTRDFRRVLRTGSRSRQGAIVVVRSPGRPGPARVGFVVSRDAGKAVRRNRIKRRLRHAVRVLQLEPDMDYVIIASAQVATARYSDLIGWVQRALRETSQ